MTTANPRLVLLDTNVFVSAIKDPARSTDTFRLLVYFLERAGIRILANEILVREYLRYAEVFPSPTAAALASAVLDRAEIVEVDERFLKACAPYFQGGNIADIVHAATCLQTGALLISNDRHFEAIRKAQLIEALTATEAIRRWVGPRSKDEDPGKADGRSGA